MSREQVKGSFEKFGDRMTLIMYFTIASLILSVIAWWIPLVGLITVIFSLIILFTFLSAVGNIKEAGMKLSNEDLLSFRTKIIIALILGIIGWLLFYIGLIGIGLIFLLTEITAAIIPYIIVIIIGIVILVIAAILTIQAWGRLKTFFASNMELFPKDVSTAAKSGAGYCKIGAILDLTVIFAFIGLIFKIFGLYKLGELSSL